MPARDGALVVRAKNYNGPLIYDGEEESIAFKKVAGHVGFVCARFTIGEAVITERFEIREGRESEARADAVRWRRSSMLEAGCDGSVSRMIFVKSTGEMRTLRVDLKDAWLLEQFCWSFSKIG